MRIALLGPLVAKPDVVVEAASHDAVRERLVPLLEAGSTVVVLSAEGLDAPAVLFDGPAPGSPVRWRVTELERFLDQPADN